MYLSCLLCAQMFVVGCTEFDWVVGWVGLWVQSFYFAIGWVGSVVWQVGLGWRNWTHGQLWLGLDAIIIFVSTSIWRPRFGLGQSRGQNIGFGLGLKFGFGLGLHRVWLRSRYRSQEFGLGLGSRSVDGLASFITTVMTTRPILLAIMPSPVRPTASKRTHTAPSKIELPL